MSGSQEETKTDITPPSKVRLVEGGVREYLESRKTEFINKSHVPRVSRVHEIGPSQSLNSGGGISCW